MRHLGADAQKSEMLHRRVNSKFRCRSSRLLPRPKWQAFPSSAHILVSGMIWLSQSLSNAVNKFGRVLKKSAVRAVRSINAGLKSINCLFRSKIARPMESVTKVFVRVWTKFFCACCARTISVMSNAYWTELLGTENLLISNQSGGFSPPRISHARHEYR